MNKYATIFVICLFFVATSCRYAEVSVATYDETAFGRCLIVAGQYIDEWYNNERMKKYFRCRGRLCDDTIECDIVNMYSGSIAVYKGAFGFQYVIEYRTETNEYEYFLNHRAIEFHFENIEILEPRPQREEVYITCCDASHVSIKLPRNCAKIIGAAIKIEFVTFEELKKCDNGQDLSKAFENNAGYVVVEFVE